MPRVIIDLPYVPEADQIASLIAQQVSTTLPGAQVQVVDAASDQGGMARGLETASTPQRPLTRPPQAGPPPGLQGPPSGPGMPADPRLAQRTVRPSPFANQIRRRV
jgi:hypothetical protein